MKAIAAVDLKWSIGKGNNLLFHIKEDMKHFKAITTGNAIAMGRKTFESLPIKPLPNRLNLVVTHSDFSYPGVKAVRDLSLLDDVIIIGGESIYQQTIDKCDVVYITKILADGHGDKFFPNLDARDDFYISETEDHLDSEIPYQFVVYKKVM